MLTRTAAALVALAAVGSTQSVSPTFTNTDREIPTLLPQIAAAPSLTPTIYDPEAPDPQQCPGYRASNVVESDHGLTADLTIAGPNCQAFGNDVGDLKLDVQYQAKSRLNVKIYPTHLSDGPGGNRTQYILDPAIVPEPEWDGSTTQQTSDLRLEWTNDPTFQFRILRAHNTEELFSTHGHRLVYEDQFLELVTAMVPDYNLYGLAENIHDWRLGTNYTQTFWNIDAGNTVDGNVYGTFPWYQETRYRDDDGKSSSHGVYARNAHGQEWLLRERSLTYRTLGGSFDFYFLSGQPDDGEDGRSSAKETIAQYIRDCVGLPAMQQYWTFGFHQSRWGYENVSVNREVVKRYRDANIPLECMWNDLDIYNLYRMFSSDYNTFPPSEMQSFISDLHANGQYYVPIIDANIYVPNPTNASDAYGPWQRGAEQGLFLRQPDTADFYYGDNWPGFSSWADFLLPESQDWWTGECSRWHQSVPFDGIWIDLSEPASICAGSCGNGRLDENPVHPPYLLPGDPLTFDYEYPDGFNVSNATEASSASSASSSQASALSVSPPLPDPTTTTRGRTEPTPGARNLNFPPYVLNSVETYGGDGHALTKGTVAPNATHNDPSNTTEYELHNVYGYQLSNATYHALLSIFPNKRPFTIGRATFAGMGRFSGHWGGDNRSSWQSMYFSISQAFTFMMSGVPMFGADTCGFSHNTDYDLCARWMALSAFFPFYRNHNVKATIGQEAYRWSAVASSARNAMGIRYSLLTYMYTLFHEAHTSGSTVMRALSWEFPDDQSLKGVGTQFLLGPSLLVTPVLEPNVDYVRGVFPGVAEGERWYDWYSLQRVEAGPGENVTLDAPIDFINVHVRGGAVLPLQGPGYTTGETRRNPYAVLAVLDAQGEASGSLYLDDGESVVQEATKMVKFAYSNSTLTTSIEGSYHAAPPLANITIAGVDTAPTGLSMTFGGKECRIGDVGYEYKDGVVRLTGLEEFTPEGAWEGDLYVKLSY